jgi:hypothetical protein
MNAQEKAWSGRPPSGQERDLAHNGSRILADGRLVLTKFPKPATRLGVSLEVWAPPT